MAELHDLNVTDASNTARFPEGMARAAVNNAARALEGILARSDRDNDGSLTTAGTSTAYTLTLNSAHSAWFNGLRFRANVHTASGATPTVNPTGSGALGAKSLYWADGTQISSDLTTGLYDFVYLSSPDKVYVVGAKPTAAATESAAGKIEIATQTEVNTGTDAVRAISPAYLTGWTPAVGTVTAATNDKVLLADTSASGVLKQALVSDIVNAAPFAIYENQQTSGTTGPTFTAGAWRTFPLTTEVVDAGAIGSLASNQVTLAAGAYEFYYVCQPGSSTAGTGITVLRTRLRDATNSATLGQSVNCSSYNAQTQVPPSLRGRFTLSGSAAIELQIYCLTNNIGSNPAVSTGEVEVYASLMFIKLG